jgi:hypothetical protein
MDYQAVGSRCAYDFSGVDVTERQRIVEVLKFDGFLILDVDAVVIAREWVGKATYRRGARMREAPAVFDCSSFAKWVYGQHGIWLPRRSIQQLAVGTPVALDQIRAGDLVFVRGWINYYHNDPSDGVGHVGLATGEGTVIHAADRRAGVVESRLERFTKDGKIFRGACRIVEHQSAVMTFITPPVREIETSDDIRWLVRILSARKSATAG